MGLNINPKYDLRAVAQRFHIAGEFLTAAPYGNGHINDTYRVAFDQGDTTTYYILQRINHNVFKNPLAMMENVHRVTAHLAQKYASKPDRSRRSLMLIPTRDGRHFYCDEQGNYWRVYFFIGKARTFETIRSAQQAFQAAKTVGIFQKLLADLPAPRLYDTIPDFHHTPKRFAALEKAIAADVAKRAEQAKAEIEFALKRKAICSVLLNANLPERVTHNDTKFNNFMHDDATGECICLVDLDTVMPGLVAYDFGDMVRSMTSPANEDERDLSKVRMQFPMFEALVRGYLSSAGEFLTPAEKTFLAVSGKVITFTIGIRFLTDFLSGDTYFKVYRKDHNLDRCRTQFKLVESIEQQAAAMNRLVETI